MTYTSNKTVNMTKQINYCFPLLRVHEPSKQLFDVTVHCCHVNFWPTTSQKWHKTRLHYCRYHDIL